MTTMGRLMLSAIVLLCMLATNGIAQQPEQDLRQELDALKQGQQAIQKNLQEIRQLLQARQPQRRPAPDVSGTVFNLRDNPVKGEQTAMLTLIEFTDYQ
jgi:hypothetical protein